MRGRGETWLFLAFSFSFFFFLRYIPPFSKHKRILVQSIIPGLCLNLAWFMWGEHQGGIGVEAPLCCFRFFPFHQFRSCLFLLLPLREFLVFWNHGKHLFAFRGR